MLFFKETKNTQVVKVDDIYHESDMIQQLIDYISLLAKGCESLVLVHSGNREISQWSRLLYGTQGDVMFNHTGFPLMTAKNIKLASMVLREINQRFVSTFEHHGIPAMGLSGVDGSVATASVLNEHQLGLVGGTPSIHVNRLRSILNIGCLVVLSPICQDRKGRQLFVDADTMAQAVAVALEADVLTYITEFDMSTYHSGMVSCVSLETVKELYAKTPKDSRMTTTLQASIVALLGGVSCVCLGDLDSLRADAKQRAA